MENKQMKCVKGESCLHCGSTYCRFVDELDQLKAENKKLEKWKKEHLNDVEFIKENPVIDILNSMAENILLEQRNEKLSQTLEEIKGIAEENIRIADLEGLNGVYRRGLAKLILQKISECEVMNE